MKKLCALVLTALLALGLCLPVHATGISPSITLSVPWDEIPDDAVYLDLLIQGVEGQKRLPATLKAKYGLEEDAEIYTYNEDNYRSISFSALIDDCSPRMTYYGAFSATAADYARYRALFDKLGGAVKKTGDPDCPYKVDAAFDYGTPEAVAAKTLADRLGQEWEYGASCEAFFGYGYYGQYVFPKSVKAALVDQNGRILRVSEPYALEGDEQELVLTFTRGRLREGYGAGLAFGRYTGTAYFFGQLLVGLFFIVFLLLLLRRMRRKKKKHELERTSWLPGFVFDTDRRRVKEEWRSRGKTADDRREIRVLLRQLAVRTAAILLLYAVLFSLIRGYGDSGLPLWALPVFTLGIFLANALHVVLHELGHVLFGKLSGLRFYAVSFGRLCVQKEDGRLRLHRCARRVAGIGGATEMRLPQRPEEEISLLPFHLGGIAVNALTAAVCFGLSFLAAQGVTRSVLLGAAALGAMLALGNLIPLPGSGTDGTKIFDELKNPGAKAALIRTSRIGEANRDGARLSDIDDALFPPVETLDLRSGSQAGLAVLTWWRALEAKDFAAAKALGQRLADDPEAALSKVVKAELRLVGLYCDVILGIYTGRPEDYLSFADKLLLQRAAYQPLLAAVKHGYALLYERNLRAADEAKRTVQQKPFATLGVKDKNAEFSMIEAAEAQAKAWGLIL